MKARATENFEPSKSRRRRRKRKDITLKREGEVVTTITAPQLPPREDISKGNELKIYEDVDVEEASDDDDDDYDDEEGSIWEDASQEDEEYDDDDIYELPDQNRHDAKKIPTNTIESGEMSVSAPISAIVVPTVAPILDANLQEDGKITKSNCRVCASNRSITNCIIQKSKVEVQRKVKGVEVSAVGKLFDGEQRKRRRCRILSRKKLLENWMRNNKSRLRRCHFRLREKNHR